MPARLPAHRQAPLANRVAEDDAQPAAIFAAPPRHRRCRRCGGATARAAASRRSTSPCAQPPQP
eukprot:8159133-Heterocapsa_arctica.AAC.1